jgi:Xaa-Pro aminopeptidase
MLLSPPQFINDGLPFATFSERSRQRRAHLMAQCDGPIVLVAPGYGPNQMYAWAQCHAPVYQDSYILYLTGINQQDIAIILDPTQQKQHIFLPAYNAKTVFWEGACFAEGDSESCAILTQLGFDYIHNIRNLKTIISDHHHPTTCWHGLIQQQGKKNRPDDHYKLKKSLSRQLGPSFQFKNICDLSWDQRSHHDAVAIDNITTGAQKTADAFLATLAGPPPPSETAICGTLIGELLKRTCYGLSFPPIIAKNANAATLHYTHNSALLDPKDLILMDFGLRWQSMCTDVSRTIPATGGYTDLQRRLMDIVLTTQLTTMAAVRSGITFNELNTIAWDTMETLLTTHFFNKGGRIKRAYRRQPHNIGHLLGIQVHDGDPNRAYRDRPLPRHAIITIEPGLYGTVEWKGDTYTYGIRIEDNLLVTDQGYQNLTQNIPKTCHDIEAIFRG